MLTTDLAPPGLIRSSRIVSFRLPMSVVFVVGNTSIYRIVQASDRRPRPQEDELEPITNVPASDYHL